MKTIAAIFTCAAITTTVYGAQIGLYNTGVNSAGVSLPAGSADPHWDILSPAQPAIVIRDSIPGTWIPNSAASRWIWQDVNGQPTGVTRRFETTFDMTGLDLASAIINGRWSSDNFGLNIFINGVDIVPPNPTSPGFSGWTAFSVSNVHLLQGMNSLVFEVQDVGAISGFRAEFLTATANLRAVPDSSNTLFLAGIGLGFLLLIDRARRTAQV